MSDRLSNLQLAIKAHLEAQEYVSNASAAQPRPITVVAEYSMRSESLLAEAVGKQKGACLFIHSPAAQVASADTPGPVYDPAIITISCFENPDVNQSAKGTGQPAVGLAEAVARFLHQQTMTGFDAPLYCVGREAVADPDFARVDVVFRTVVALIPFDQEAPIRANRLTP